MTTTPPASSPSATQPLNVRIPTDLHQAITEATQPGQTRTSVVVALLTSGLQYLADAGAAEAEVESLMARVAGLGVEAVKREDVIRTLRISLDRVGELLAADSSSQMAAMLEEIPADDIAARELGQRLINWSARLAARPSAAASAPGALTDLVLDPPLRERLMRTAESLALDPLLAGLGLQVSLPHVVRLALTRGAELLEAEGPAAALPSRPTRHHDPEDLRPTPAARPTPGSPRPARIVAAAAPTPTRPQMELEGKATASGEFGEKQPDVPLEAPMAVPRGPGGYLAPDETWSPWSPQDGDIAPDERGLHAYYEINGWTRWTKPLASGRLLTFYWCDDPRAQSLPTYPREKDLVVEVLPTGDRGVGHAVGRLQ